MNQEPPACFAAVYARFRVGLEGKPAVFGQKLPKGRNPGQSQDTMVKQYRRRTWAGLACRRFWNLK
ncbi:hypothetical protein F1640_19860 [Novosphingobium sp. NBM11]|uniref:hypothetical protein n=1 Tax=unclassified Novosphingobium TaxID=2644732 RepID=UPI001891FD20|nr:MULTISPECIES: hypothetical protein [unclassified Novosphingobium]MBF5092205.1 hypothetical protein [Novosphingobium sp. NBM11]